MLRNPPSLRVSFAPRVVAPPLGAVDAPSFAAPAQQRSGQAWFLVGLEPAGCPPLGVPKSLPQSTDSALDGEAPALEIPDLRAATR
jgi:hypothetical protein